MLKTIEKIARVGVFNDADGTGFPLERLTLIYAGNGHGKSTLCAVLSAAACGDNEAIKRRHTLGASKDPLVRLETGDTKRLVYGNQGWTGPGLDFSVFNTEFVDRNVHTGGEVSASHRAEFLTFAIGEVAVAQEALLEKAQEDTAAAKEKLRQNEAEILVSAHAIDKACTVDSFDTTSVPPNAGQKVAQAETALTEARNVVQISAQAMPNELSADGFLSDEFFDALSTGLPDVRGEARARVAAHVQHLEQQATGGKAEAWLSQGTKFSDGANCPFCGQGVQEIDLVDMYADFFDEAYDKLRSRVDALTAVLGNAARERRRAAWLAAREQAEGALSAWRTHVQLPELPDLNSLEDCLNDFGAWADAHLESKKERLEVSLDARGDKQRGLGLERAILAPIVDVNKVIRDARDKIAAYKASLTSVSVPQLQAELTAARLEQHRGTPEVLALFATRKSLQEDIKTHEAAAKAARAEITKAMNSTLKQFEKSINEHLREQDAKFSVENSKATFAGGGGTSRGNYALNLDGHSIDVSRGVPPFQLALSEGDKRTLAFAFFCANVLSKTDLRGRTIVVDDPVTSLDKDRRTHSINVLNEMSRRGAQIIVLAHDAPFLRDVRDRFANSGPDNYGESRPATELQLERGEKYASLASIDLDLECASTYFRHHQTLRHFINKEAFDGKPVTHTEAGQAIRPLIEAYLHRRFPGGLIPKHAKMLGSAIKYIREVDSMHPVAYAKPLLSELDDLNDFATRYHHDSGADAGYRQPNKGEVDGFARRALNLVYGAHG